MPAPSWPSRNGKRADAAKLKCRSVWQTPLASTRTSTSPGAWVFEDDALDRRGLSNVARHDATDVGRHLIPPT